MTNPVGGETLTITAGSTIGYTAGGDYEYIDPGLTVSGDALITELTVTVASGYLAGDTLACTASGITTSYSNGTLTIQPKEPGLSADQIQSIFRAVEYKFNGSDPTKGGTDTSRKIVFTAYAGTQQFSGSSTVDDSVCFASGTEILTPSGPVAVENLHVGDIVLNSSGEERKVKWIGHRTVQCPGHANPRLLWPVRIAAHAFGPERPGRDLLVSHNHAICVTCVEEILIPADQLANGSTIAQVPVDEVTYWHVELDSHDILLANGLPAESYIDMGNRNFFIESSVTSIAAVAGRRPNTFNDYCRPFMENGETVDFVRRILRARAEHLGWTASTEMDLHLQCAGQRMDGQRAGDTYRFRIPANADDVVLCSSVFIPSQLGEGDDRRLGACLLKLLFSDASGGSIDVPLSDPRLDEGCHSLEQKDGKDWRWTNGALPLRSSLWGGLSGDVELRVTVASGAIRGWRAPSPERAAMNLAQKGPVAAVKAA